MKNQVDKLVQGTARKDRIKTIKGKALTSLPDPPRSLRKAVEKIYYQVGNTLIEMEVLRNTDLRALCNFAEWSYVYETAMKKALVRGGMYQVFSNKTRNVSPEFTVVRTAQDVMFRFYQRLGLTPYDRDKIQSFQSEPELPSDPYALLLGNTN